MDILEFCKKVEKSLADLIGEGTVTGIEKIHKNNGIVLHGITVKEKGVNVSLNIYLDEFHEAYESGTPFSKIMQEVFHIYQENRIEKDIDIDFFADYEAVKQRLCYRVIGAESNTELLEQVPYVPFLDMAITFYCDVDAAELDIGNGATIQIRNSHLEKWGVTKEKLYQDAKRNMPCIHQPMLQPIEKAMMDACDPDLHRMGETGGNADRAGEDAGQILEHLQKSKMSMYVLQSRKRLFGAAVMLYEGILERIAQTLGSGFYLLPSSIHEVILVMDNNGRSAEEVQKMVREINAAQEDAQDILTNSVYFFPGSNKKLEKVL